MKKLGRSPEKISSIFKREEKEYFNIVCHYIFIANWPGTRTHVNFHIVDSD